MAKLAPSGSSGWLRTDASASVQFVPWRDRAGRAIAGGAAYAQAAAMVAIAALTLLAQTATALLPPPPALRLSAGVKVERAVASPGSPPFAPLGAAIAVRKTLLGKPVLPIS